jgi:hypothetical protein
MLFYGSVGRIQELEGYSTDRVIGDVIFNSQDTFHSQISYNFVRLFDEKVGNTFSGGKGETKAYSSCVATSLLPYQDSMI